MAAALANPRRRVVRLAATREMLERLAPLVAGRRDTMACEAMTTSSIAALLDGDARHQGAALLVHPLPDLAIHDIPGSADIVLVLDRISDPRNAGAIMRSAAAFGAAAVVMQDRHAPPPSAAFARAASGALEWVPLVRVSNIARALDDLKHRGFWITGLDAEASLTLGQEPVPLPAALVLGAEGSGLRRLVAETCDQLV
ncbi:MAG: RNA methyltransferase, partial [bacterium]|nr:RNA methyltransferase [bacterium]